METHRIKGITGIKGVGALVVLVYHFCQQFLPSVVTNSEADRLYYWEKIISESPLYIIVNAQFFISVFWAISGFLMSYYWYLYHCKEKMREKVIKKYIPYSGEFLFTNIVSFFLLYFNHYYSVSIPGGGIKTIYNFQPDFADAMIEAVYDCFFLGKAQYNPVLWTMKVELIGTILLSGWLIIWGDTKKRGLWWITICCILLLYEPSYLPMMGGAIMGDIYVNRKVPFNKLIIFFSIFAIILLGGIPFVHPSEGIYRFLPKWNVWIYYALSVPFVIIIADNIQFFSNQLCMYFGKYSFQIYLLHFIIQCSATNWFYLKIYKQIAHSYMLLLFSTFIFHLVVVLFCVTIYAKTIERLWNHMVKKIILYLCE